MPASKSDPIPRARTNTRKHRSRLSRRRRTPLWPAIIAVFSVGVILMTAAAVVRQRLNRNRVAPSIKVIAVSSDATQSITPRTTQGLRPAPTVPAPEARRRSADTAQSDPRRQREQTVTIGSFKYRKTPPSAEQLTQQLAAVQEVGLDLPLDDPVAQGLIKDDRDRLGTPRHFHPFALAMRDVHSLPLRMGHDCQLSHEPAEILQSRSRGLREHLAKSTSASAVRESLKKEGARMWRVPSAIPTLVQMLQAEGEQLRLLLIELLASIEGPEASRALARRAIFDVSSDVRHAAVNALSKRSRRDYRDLLVDSLRHAWPEAADFAATALVKLQEKQAVPDLVRLLDEPDPTAPFMVNDGANQTYHVREMVRINHLRNCVVCHAVSFDASNFVRAAVPDPKAPLPPAFSPAYYKHDSGRLFVRADVTYLKQDFSLPQAVDNHGVWPSQQRYDYCVRTQPLSATEWKERRRSAPSYPQRESVLFALRELTGEDPGDRSADWEKVSRRFSN